MACPSSCGLAAPEHYDAENDLATACVRPHDIDVDAKSSDNTVPATIDHAVAPGSVVRLELSRGDNGAVVEVEIPRDRYDGLRLGHGNVVWHTPRRARFFLKDAARDAASAT